MAPPTAARAIVPVQARQRPSGDISIAIGDRRPITIARAAAAQWFATPTVPPKSFGHRRLLSRALGERVDREKQGAEDATVVISLDVTADLHVLDWERAISAALPVSRAVVVRTSQVRPRIMDWPLSLPVRVLQAGVLGVDVGSAVERAFEGRHRDDIGLAVVTAVCELDEVSGFQLRESWPTVDVLHLASFPDPGDSRPRSTASEVPGTAGWLERIIDRLRVRLVVVEASSDTEASWARVVASTIAARGAPAIVIASPAATGGLDAFYRRVVRDEPIDLAATVDTPFPFTVFGGKGREDLLRVSKVADELVSVSIAGWHPTAIQLPGYPTRVDRRVDRLIENAGGIADAFDFRFDPNEDTDVLEIGRSVGAAIEAAGVNVIEPLPIRVVQPRFVNAQLQFIGEAGELDDVDQDTPLVVGEPVQLSLAVGEASLTIRTARAAALADRVLFNEGEDGVWIEFGVTGIDFELVGDPVQRLWLSREGASGIAGFTVIPKRRGVAALRFCLYVGQTLVQSFRLAAVTVKARDEQVPARRKLDLARRLDLPVDEVGETRWLPRLEFSLTPDVFELDGRERRSVSIVANDLEGEKRVTVKGTDVWGSVVLPGSVIELVDAARTTLDQIATPPVEDSKPSHWSYGYGTTTDENEARPGRLLADLGRLAEQGWRLYSQLIPKDEREPLAERLAQSPDQIIEVAHVLLKEVIPWALVYDRPYFANARKDESGTPYVHAVCPASLPDANGVMPDVECSRAATCLLHPAAAAGNVSPKTVICANRFWGFRHQIELPAQQALDGRHPTPIPAHVESGASVRLGVAMHGGLFQGDEHLSELHRLATVDPGGATIAWTVYDSDVVREILETDLELDVVDLYCHAEGGRTSHVAGEQLRFRAQDPDAQEGLITAPELEGETWEHRPVVILNGCRTAAFSPDSLSSFIVTLIGSRKASALLATEISVWEQLARRVAHDFLRAFLGSATTGMSLLHARRQLLAIGNPLGLAYTLYGVTDLTIVREGVDETQEEGAAAEGVADTRQLALAD